MANVKKFLQKWIVHNLGFKILALVFAFGLWLVITNTTDPVMTRTISGIPVQILNEEMVLDGSRVYTVESGSTATIVVSGKRSIVGNMTVADVVATADFAELSITHAVPIKIELTGEKARYAASVGITLKTHSMVINLEDMTEVTMTVNVEFSGSKPENMIIEDAAASPAKVTFYAPESVAQQADRVVALIGYSEIEGDTTLQKKLVVYDVNGFPISISDDQYLDVDVVNVVITTNMIKNVPVRIEPYGEVAEGYELLDISYSKKTVPIRGSEEVLAQISELVLPTSLLYVQDAKEDVTLTINMEEYLPYGATFYGETGTITITATIKKIEEKSEDVTEPETEE